MGLWTVSVVREKHHDGDTVKQIALSKTKWHAISFASIKEELLNDSCLFIY